MVRDRSPSSSPVRNPNLGITGTHGPLSPPPRGRSFDGTNEAPVSMIYGTVIGGAESPPQSAQSMKEEPCRFKYSLRKKNTADTTPSVSSAVNPFSGAPLVFGVTSPIHTLAAPAYDKPKPIVTSPEKKDQGPKSFVQSRIQMFTMPDEIKPANQKSSHTESIPSLAPPPVPTRPQRLVKSYTIDTESLSPTSPTSPSYSKPFTSRERLRPFSPTDKQRAISKLLHDLPVSEHSAFHQPAPKYTNPFAKSTNPFLSSPDTMESKTPAGSQKSPDKVKQAYLSSRCSSDESLTEFSSLLKEDEKSDSRSSLCIYFDGKDIPDTLV